MNDELLNEFQDKLNYHFTNIGLLINSLTHSSYANENVKSGITSNERLEFLGDSLLGMMVALLIYNSKPDLTEGQMTKLRAELVCEKSLAALALKLDLGLYLILGRGEDSGGGRCRPSILSDAMEAVLAAIYLDGGYGAVEQFISSNFIELMENSIRNSSDYKTLLQEIIQLNHGHTLLYDIIAEHGPDHDKSFTVAVRLNDNIVGTGSGKSKKNAEQKAAQAAIEFMKHKYI
ncbi:MAG: ribonuclease III [Oscillospiraceae bacterium]|jgi:ribonuclease-3|nr:ribonuclease III [Oscillospiraceae bacterium]